MVDAAGEKGAVRAGGVKEVSLGEEKFEGTGFGGLAGAAAGVDEGGGVGFALSTAIVVGGLIFV